MDLTPGRHAFFEVLCCLSRVPRSPVTFLVPPSGGRQSAALQDWSFSGRRGCGRSPPGALGGLVPASHVCTSQSRRDFESHGTTGDIDRSGATESRPRKRYSVVPDHYACHVPKASRGMCFQFPTSVFLQWEGPRLPPMGNPVTGNATGWRQCMSDFLLPSTV